MCKIVHFKYSIQYKCTCVCVCILFLDILAVFMHKHTETDLRTSYSRVILPVVHFIPSHCVPDRVVITLKTMPKAISPITMFEYMKNVHGHVDLHKNRDTSKKVETFFILCSKVQFNTTRLHFYSDLFLIFFFEINMDKLKIL